MLLSDTLLRCHLSGIDTLGYGGSHNHPLQSNNCAVILYVPPLESSFRADCCLAHSLLKRLYREGGRLGWAAETGETREMSGSGSRTQVGGVAWNVYSWYRRVYQ